MQGKDDGVGLIEVVVAMFVFAIFSLAFLPVLITGLRASAENSTRSTGIQLMQQQIEVARRSASCGAVRSMDGLTDTVTDPRGVDFTSTVEVDLAGCPTDAAGYPMTVPLSVSVVRDDTGEVLGESDTLIYVSAP